MGSSDGPPRLVAAFVGVIIGFALALAVGVGATTKTVTHTVVHIRTLTVHTEVPFKVPPRPMHLHKPGTIKVPGLVYPTHRPNAAPPRPVHAILRAPCVVQMVAPYLASYHIVSASFCSSTRWQNLQSVPSSPFATKGECRLDVTDPAPLNFLRLPALNLGQTRGSFSARCHRIRFVIYSTEGAGGYDPAGDAPAVQGALQPGQRKYLRSPY